MNIRGKLQDWHAFVLVAQLGSFSAAAKHLGIGVSTVSKSISRLEEGINATLLNRDTHSVQLTDAGTLACEQAVLILEMMDELISSISNTSQDIQGSLRLTAPALVCEFLANEWVTEYMERHKKVSIFLESRESSQFSKESSAFDHLIFRSGIIHSDDLVHCQLSPLQLSICASRKYIASHDDLFHPADLVKHSFLWVHDFDFEGSLKFRRGNDEYILNKSEAHRYSSDNLLGAFNLVLKGKGISITTPGFLAQNTLRFQDVITVLDEWKIEPIPIYIIWRQRRFYSPLFRDFINFISHKWNERETLSKIK